MARKLTGEERDDVESLRSALVGLLSPEDRGLAAGLASALVRLPSNQLGVDDLQRIMTKYPVSNAAIDRMVEGGVLIAANDSQVTVEHKSADGEDASRADAILDNASLDDANLDDASPDSAADGLKAEGQGFVHTSHAALYTIHIPHPNKKAHPNKEELEAKQETKRKAKNVKDENPKPDSAPAEGGAPEALETEPTDPIDVKEEAPQVESTKANDTRDTDKQSCDRDIQLKARDADKQSRDEGIQLKARELPRRDLRRVPYVRRGGESEAELRQKILALDTRFWVNGWLLSHPSAYTMYESELNTINLALVDGMLSADLTRRQLAYRIGGDEKFFEYGSDGNKLLRAMGMEDIIRHRPIPKYDLVYHAPRRRKHMSVLVTENLDPYLDVHSLMYEDGRTQILGKRIHAVVLGGGTPIIEHNRLSLLLDSLGADSTEVLYWGDIDRAGINLMMKLKEELDEKYELIPFMPAYRLMITKAMERFPDPCENEATSQMNIDMPDTSLLYQGLSQAEVSYVQTVLLACGLVPQEILTRADL